MKYLQAHNNCHTTERHSQRHRKCRDTDVFLKKFLSIIPAFNRKKGEERFKSQLAGVCDPCSSNEPTYGRRDDMGHFGAMARGTQRATRLQKQMIMRRDRSSKNEIIYHLDRKREQCSHMPIICSVAHTNSVYRKFYTGIPPKFLPINRPINVQ